LIYLAEGEACLAFSISRAEELLDFGLALGVPEGVALEREPKVEAEPVADGADAAGRV
jgi:hypothetical protein